MSTNIGAATSTGSQPGRVGLAQLTQQDAARLAGYRRYLDFYNGSQWEGLPAPNEKRLTFNYARVFVNKAASYLMGKGVSFAVTPPEGAGGEGRAIAQHVEGLLQACYERNSLALVDLDTAVDSAVLGDGAFKVTWDGQAGAPSVAAVDPAGLFCVRQADDYRRLLKVRQVYSVGAGDRGSGVSSNGAQSLVTEEWTAETLEVWRDGVLEQRVANPYGVIPYVVFPNLRVPKEPWGQSDLVDVIEANRDLNSRLSILSHILIGDIQMAKTKFGPHRKSGMPVPVLGNYSSPFAPRFCSDHSLRLSYRERSSSSSTSTILWVSSPVSVISLPSA